jgi:hypothetical protein
VFGHGFRFRPIWWMPRVPNGWGSYLNELPALHRGYQLITPCDLAKEQNIPIQLVGDHRYCRAMQFITLLLVVELV